MKIPLFGVLSLMALAVWAAQEPATVPVDSSADDQAPRFGVVTLGAPAPQFRMMDEKGANTDISAFSGRTVVVHFFTGSRPQPFLQKIATKYGESVSVLAVSMADRKAFDAWLAAGKSKVSYPVAWDPADGDRAKSIAKAQFGIGMFPATAIIDGAGNLVDGVIGYGSSAERQVYMVLDRAGVPLLAADRPKVAAPRSLDEIAPAPQGQARPTLIAVGTQAPDFVTQDIDGNDVRLSDFLGKVVVLDFWATWCGPCKAAMPGLERVHQETQDKGVVVLASCTADTREAYEKWVDDNSERYTFRTAHDAGGKSADSASKKLFGVSGIPTQFIIGRDGIIIDAIVGANEKRLGQALAKAGIELESAEQTAQAGGL